MKKTIILLFILCLISFSNVWAGSLNEFFPVQTSMIINLDLAESKAYMDLAQNSMLNKTYNDVMLCLNKKLSIDLAKDLKEIRICFIKVKIGFLNIENSVPFVFVNGNFKSKDAWFSIIKSLAKETSEQEAKISSISLNGEEKTVFNVGKYQFIFLNDSVLFIGVNGCSELLDKGKITFKKAPQHLNKVSKMANSYLYFNKDFINRLPIISGLFADTKSFDSVTVFIKDNNINFMTYVKDIRLIDEKTNNLKNSIYRFKKRYTEIFEQEKRWLKEAPLSDFAKISKTIYSDAFFKKIIDNLKISTSFNFIIVSLPLENYLKEHLFIFFINSMISDFYYKFNNGVHQACSENISQIFRAVTAYKENDNSDLYNHSSFIDKKEDNNEGDECEEDDEEEEDDDDDEKEEGYYTSRRLRGRVRKPNKSGRFSMILDIKSLLENDSLVIEPLKPDPDCEYVLYRDSEINRLMIVCLKHSFCSIYKTSFGSIFNEKYMPVGFGRNLNRNKVIDARNCYLYQKEISDSVDKYNKNHKPKMSKLDINTLLKSGFLKKPVSNLNTNCEYYSEGDLTSDDACISCKTHGPESYKVSLEDKIMKMWKIRQINFTKVDCDRISEKDIKEIENCCSNIRKIESGIYNNNLNKDSVKITKDLNDSVINDLVNKKYIWKLNYESTPECKYYIEGDLTNNGHVACKKHGYVK